MKKSFSALLQPLGKVAVAAAVAFVAVLGVQQLQIPGVSVSQSATVATALDSNDTGDAQFQLPAGYDLPPVSARTVSTGSVQQSFPQSRPSIQVSPQAIAGFADEYEVREYFNTMMQRHTETAARSSSNQGPLPFARLPQAQGEGQ